MFVFIKEYFFPASTSKKDAKIEKLDKETKRLNGAVHELNEITRMFEDAFELIDKDKRK